VVMRQLTRSLDLSAELELLDNKLIDEQLVKVLRDGDVLLVRCAWILGLDDGTVLVRRQELPAQAFFAPEEAVALVREQRRKILALSYGWQTPSHPDPCGLTLKAVSAHLRRAQQQGHAVHQLGLFLGFFKLLPEGNLTQRAHLGAVAPLSRKRQL